LTSLAHLVRRGILLQRVGLGGACLAVALALSTVVAALGWPLLGATTAVAAAAAAAVYACWPLVHERAGSMDSLARCARLASDLAPELGSAPLSALDLSRRLSAPNTDFSRDLALFYVDGTHHRLASVDFAYRWKKRQRRPLQRSGLLALSGALLLLACAFAFPAGLHRIYNLLHPGSARQISELPLVGDIRVTYRYPAYTHVSPRIVEGGDGSLSAVPGTQVELEATADRALRAATLLIGDEGAREGQPLEAEIERQRHLRARFSILHDGRYRFLLHDKSGDHRQELYGHPIHAVADMPPEVSLDEPANDVELKDRGTLVVRWEAKDDFGLGDVNLVVEAPSLSTPHKLPLAKGEAQSTRRQGRNVLSVAELGLTAGEDARLYVEAFDNDAMAGPKRSVSVSRRITLFSAQKLHESALLRERGAIEALVDWLGVELVHPFAATLSGAALKSGEDSQRQILQQANAAATILAALVNDLHEDRLTRGPIVSAYANTLDHVRQAVRRRGPLLANAGGPAAGAALQAIHDAQQDAVGQLEQDIIYLDDLWSLQRIQDLKSTAQELLAAQAKLKDLLAQYKTTQDPTLKAQIEQQIRDLRAKMQDLLVRMSQIRKSLPTEYRNLEAATMAEVDQKIDRLEDLLAKGDLDGAAREVELLANQIESMVNHIDRAEDEFGGEKYAAIRKKLNEFANEFRALENQQHALADRSNEFLAEYRKQAVAKAGHDLDSFVQKARRKAAEALKNLDGMAEVPLVYGSDREVNDARARLLDADALIAHRDFAEAREMSNRALTHAETIGKLLEGLPKNDGRGAYREARQAHGRALRSVRELVALLDQLFPSPEQVLSPEKMAELRGLANKQGRLRQQADKIGKTMDELAGQLPLFGGDVRSQLSDASGEMGQAASAIHDGSLGDGSDHAKRAADALGQIRQALEQAAKQGGGKGMPLPMNMGTGSGGDSGAGGDMSHEPVEIPRQDAARARPRFRQNLLEAAKQPAPEHYEEAVRKYYEELVR